MALPVADMREEPNGASEVVSQAYFSEEVKPLKEVSDWVKIETTIDGYRGWIQRKALCQREEPFPSDPSSVILKVKRCAAHVYSAPKTIYGPIATLPFDSKLQMVRPQPELESSWIEVLLVDGRQGYIQSGNIAEEQELLGCNQICSLSLQFLGLPYTWGGRSSFGYDCSGFVQMLYRQMGIYLPRDAKDQIGWEGLIDVSLDALFPGDLIFFGLSENKIVHVGMSLGGGQFIHATASENAPYIRISSLSDPLWSGSGRFSHRAARRLKLKLERLF